MLNSSLANTNVIRIRKLSFTLYTNHRDMTSISTRVIVFFHNELLFPSYSQEQFPLVRKKYTATKNLCRVVSVILNKN